MATQTVWGVVNSNGTAQSGSGFTVQYAGTGQYSITFDNAFSDIPSIVGSQVLFGSLNENTMDTVVFPQLTSKLATALTGEASGKHQDRNFSFIAIGFVNA